MADDQTDGPDPRVDELAAELAAYPQGRTRQEWRLDSQRHSVNVLARLDALRATTPGDDRGVGLADAAVIERALRAACVVDAQGHLVAYDDDGWRTGWRPVTEVAAELAALAAPAETEAEDLTRWLDGRLREAAENVARRPMVLDRDEWVGRRAALREVRAHLAATLPSGDQR